MTPGNSSPLTAKTALVTGAAKRLGRAIALALGGEGVKVAVRYSRSAAAAAQTADELRAADAEAWTLQADPAQRETAAAWIAGEGPEDRKDSAGGRHAE